MQSQDEGGTTPPKKEEHLQVQVRYVAARQPYNEKVDPALTLQAFKPSVLAFFHLVEGSTNGGTKVYNFTLDGAVLTNTSVTLGELAAGKHELKLILVEELTQG